MSTCETVTLTVQLPKYRADAQTLSEILERFQSYDDPLSKSLFHWGAGVLQIGLEHSHDSVEEITRIARERIVMLAKEVLVNPLDGSPLEDPVIERDWTWERWVHADCRKVFSAISPFDGSPMSLEPASHLFAREMIGWMHSVTFSRSPPIVTRRLEQGQMKLLASNPQLAGIQRFVYQQLVQRAILQGRHRQLREEMDYVLVRVDSCMAEMREKDLQVTRAAEASAAGHEAALQKQIDSINRVHSDTVAGLNGLIASMEETNSAEVAAIERRISLMDQINITALAALRSQLTMMKLDHHTAITALESQIDALNRAHVQIVDKFDKQLAFESQAYEAHSRIVSDLQTRVADSARRVDEVQTELRHERELTVLHTGELQTMKSAFSQAQREIDRLRKACGESDCIFM